MAVPASKRKEADSLFYTNYYKLYDNITKFLLQNFGTKPLKDKKVFTNRCKMDEEDKELFLEMSEKYNFQIESNYPEWVLEHFRNSIMECLDKGLADITAAYTIYPNTVYECNVKREHQWNAISELNYLKQLLQRAISIFAKEADIEKYMVHIEAIDKEIELLRKWKQNENKIRYKCIENELKLYEETNERLNLGITIPEYTKLKQQRAEQEKKIKKQQEELKLAKQKEKEIQDYNEKLKSSRKVLRQAVYFYKDYPNCESVEDILKENSMIYIGYKFNKEKAIDINSSYYERNPLFTIYKNEERRIPNFSKLNVI